MQLILRIVGAVWVLLTLKTVFGIFQGLLRKGIHFNLDLTHLLSLIMLAGGIGLLLLKDWGRWILLLGSIAYLLLLVGPSLIQGQLGPVAIRNFVFYGIFVALLIIPQAKSALNG